MVDKNVFMLTFKHEADVRKAWNRRPWCIRGEHLILKKINANLSLNEVDFKTTKFWVQVHGLPLNTQNEKKIAMYWRFYWKSHRYMLPKYQPKRGGDLG